MIMSGTTSFRLIHEGLDNYLHRVQPHVKQALFAPECGEGERVGCSLACFVEGEDLHADGRFVGIDVHLVRVGAELSIEFVVVVQVPTEPDRMRVGGRRC